MMHLWHNTWRLQRWTRQKKPTLDGFKSVEDALLHLAAEEKVQNYHSSKSNKEVPSVQAFSVVRSDLSSHHLPLSLPSSLLPMRRKRLVCLEDAYDAGFLTGRRRRRR
ncbi:uncharacterized protein LOC142788224 [Rhipicephalus microplus]|uniref:uncharacterized protein LOC142788224 n=1 Tax=Rhipicephalus microplus TaxID=6941 RepID=UPI003F6C20A3